MRTLQEVGDHCEDGRTPTKSTLRPAGPECPAGSAVVTRSISGLQSVCLIPHVGGSCQADLRYAFPLCFFCSNQKVTLLFVESWTSRCVAKFPSPNPPLLHCGPVVFLLPLSPLDCGLFLLGRWVDEAIRRAVESAKGFLGSLRSGKLLLSA